MLSVRSINQWWPYRLARKAKKKNLIRILKAKLVQITSAAEAQKMK